VKGALQPGVRPRELWAWAMYDFANSGFTTVVITALFNAYFVTVVAGNTPWATFAWTASLSVSYVLIVLSGPLLGAYADRHAAKKRLLLITTAGCVLFTALLWFARPELLWYSVACVIAANFFFGSGENLIAAFLPELAQPRTLGRVSGWGWSLGYLGGLLTLGFCLAYVTWAEARGHGAAEFVPVTMLITAGIFALASLPTFLLLKERAVPRPADAIPCSAPLAEAWREVGHTLRQTRQFADLARFLLCSLFYQAGIQTVITLAAIYAGQAMGFGTRETLLLVFAVNITAAIGAFAFGRVQDRIGHVPAIALTLGGWIVTVLIAWAAPVAAAGETLFWIAANLAGLCMGAAQSAGRALVGLLAPSARLAEFYGFWGLSVKLSSIAGPLSYGIITWASDGDHRSALLLTGSYFVIGLFLLSGVKVARGRRAALRAERLDKLAASS
jgi:UMF1 family MFS transporter